MNASQPFASGCSSLPSFGFVLAYALPLTFVPLRGARGPQRSPPAELNAAKNVQLHQLAAYFGRRTGALAVNITLLAVRAAGDPAAPPDVLEIISVACLGMSLVHLFGAVRRDQP